MRYAILFAGMPDRRHLNGLEFSYRTLVDRYGFESDNIHVLIHDGSLLAATDPPDMSVLPPWPGDGTPYRMRATGQGSRQAFRSALAALTGQLGEEDLLFINTAGHGGNYGDGRGPYLIAYPYWDQYTMQEFCDDLAGLPCLDALLVLMAQCFSGGFNKAVVGASPAKRTFIAAAATERSRSHATATDLNWDSFQRNWIGALARQDVNGSALRWLPAIKGRGRIDVHAAFDYANDPRVRDPRDTPEWAASSAKAERLTLEAGLPALRDGAA